tara:strand:+ start:127 stop:702 length:576 start_codon:yes stop_codon:yes gene_type:complete
LNLKSIKNILLDEFKALQYWFITSYPESYIGVSLRKKYWTSKLKKCGSSPEFKQRSGIGFPELVEVGDNFSIGNGSLITAAGSKGIYIGNNVGIARGTYIHASNHRTDGLDIPIIKQGVTSIDIGFKGKKYGVVIEDDVWIGSNVVILSGTKIGKGSVIAAGAVVSGEFLSSSVIVGNPARVSMKRNLNNL